VMANDPDAVARAVASGADVNAKVYYGDGMIGGKCTAVYLAARYNKLRALRFLLGAAGANPNANTDSNGFTPYRAACYNHHHDAVRILFACGARLDHSTGTGGWGGSKCTCPADIPHAQGCTCVQCE